MDCHAVAVLLERNDLMAAQDRGAEPHGALLQQAFQPALWHRENVQRAAQQAEFEGERPEAEARWPHHAQPGALE